MPLKNNRLNHQIGQAMIGVPKKFLAPPFRPKERLPIAKELGETSLMFLVHPTLSDTDMDKTCAVLKEICVKASL